MTSNAAAPAPSPYFFSPLIDFLLIGGFGIVFLIVAYVFLPQQGGMTDNIIAMTFWVAFFINYPHFAFSYQLLYENIGSKLRDKKLPSLYRLKMFNAAFTVPVVIIGLLVISYATQNRTLMQYMHSGLLFFVGWHYVKQGYGMLIVMSAKRHFFFNATEKFVILAHTYSAWLLNWVFFNRFNKSLLIIKNFPAKRIMIPDPLVIAVVALFLVTFVIIVAECAIRFYTKKKLPPFMGVTGYISAVYLWNLAVFAHPVFIAFIPALHSLQYEMFVLKYKKTEHEAYKQTHSPVRTFLNPFTLFILTGGALGALGFYFIPSALDHFFPLDNKIFGSSFFAFCFIIFINIHHYFIDNVIWRKENEKVRAYL